jgi:predicted Fe-Mo cluster-binding NifX family protein
MIPDLGSIKIGQPAHRALQGAGIETLEQLTNYREEELLALHGFGPKALGILRNTLAECGLYYKGDRD